MIIKVTLSPGTDLKAGSKRFSLFRRKHFSKHFPNGFQKRLYITLYTIQRAALVTFSKPEFTLLETIRFKVLLAVS